VVELVETTVGSVVELVGRHTGAMRLLPVGRHAVLAEVADAAEALELAGWARDEGVEAVEVVPAATTVLFDGVSDPDALAPILTTWTPSGVRPEGELVRVPVVYDGPDLDFVADAWGTDRDGVIAQHSAIEYTAAFCGFAPGFAYLRGLPETLAVPRLESPRPAIPAGSVGLAGSWCGVYPSASPGGWRLLGRTDAVLWDQDRDRPALLAPGTRVEFVPR
jgi:KipI family sensor histidine kinase inhibitor